MEKEKQYLMKIEAEIILKQISRPKTQLSTPTLMENPASNGNGYITLFVTSMLSKA